MSAGPGTTLERPLRGERPGRGPGSRRQRWCRRKEEGPPCWSRREPSPTAVFSPHLRIAFLSNTTASSCTAPVGRQRWVSVRRPGGGLACQEPPAGEAPGPGLLLRRIPGQLSAGPWHRRGAREPGGGSRGPEGWCGRASRRAGRGPQGEGGPALSLRETLLVSAVPALSSLFLSVDLCRPRLLFFASSVSAQHLVHALVCINPSATAACSLPSVHGWASTLLLSAATLVAPPGSVCWALLSGGVSVGSARRSCPPESQGHRGLGPVFRAAGSFPGSGWEQASLLRSGPGLMTGSRPHAAGLPRLHGSPSLPVFCHFLCCTCPGLRGTFRSGWGCACRGARRCLSPVPGHCPWWCVQA